MKEKQKSLQMSDFITQLNILVRSEDEIMVNCGLIFPAIGFINDAIKETLEAMKTQALNEIGVGDEIEKIFSESSTNHNWDFLDDFMKWEKEKCGCINHKRKVVDRETGKREGK